MRRSTPDSSLRHQERVAVALGHGRKKKKKDVHRDRRGSGATRR